MNKKWIMTAVAAAIVVSMQASTVFAGEVSDSDLEPTVTQSAADAAEETVENEAAEDEAVDDEAAEEEAAEDEDEPTVEDIQALIDQYIEAYKADPDADDEDVAQAQAVLNGLLKEITQSEQFLNSELTLADVKEYFEFTLESISFTDEDEEPITSGKCGDNLTWEFDEETGTLTISGSGDMYDFSDEDYTDNWWYDVVYDIKKVVFKGNITSISDGAFVGSDIETLEIPASVTSIGENPFGINDFLSSINVAAGNQSYASQDGVLFNKSMTELLLYPTAKKDKSYTVPDSVKAIGNGAFGNCNNLTDVTIGDSVTVIGVGAFADCYRLDKVTLGNSVQYINDWAFADSGLASITLPHWIQFIEYSAFDGCDLTDVYYLGTEEEWKSLELDDVFTEEGSDYPVLHFVPAESYDEPLPWEAPEEEPEEEIKFDEETLADLEESINDFIQEIKDDEDIPEEQADEIEAFLTEWLNIVKKIDVNDSEKTQDALEELWNFFEEFYEDFIDEDLDTIETSGRCGDDLTWEFDIDTGVLTIKGNGDMYDYYEDPNEDENAADDVDEDIEDEELEEDEELDTNYFIQFLTDEFFSLYIDEDDEEEIPWWDFGSLITDVKFVGNVTSISEDAFTFCDLTTVDIPASVKYIGKDAFYGNTRLKSINVAKDNEYYSSIDGVLFDKSGETLLFYPVGKSDKTYTVPDTVTRIEEESFYGCRYLNKITFPASVTAIGDLAFANCSQLRSFTAENIETLGFGAFMNCYKLQEAELGSQLASVETAAFSQTSLTQITLPNTLVYLRYDVFEDSDIADVYYLGTEEEWNAISFYDFELDEEDEVEEEDEEYLAYLEEEKTEALAKLAVHYQPIEEEEPSEEEPSEQEEPSDNPASGNAVTDNDSKADDDSSDTADTTKTTDTAESSKSDSKTPSGSKNTGKKSSSHKTPSKSEHNKNPKTGEESAALPLIALIASAFTMAAAFAASRFRKLRGEEI